MDCHKLAIGYHNQGIGCHNFIKELHLRNIMAMGCHDFLKLLVCSFVEALSFLIHP